jgi:DNA repair protein RadC
MNIKLTESDKIKILCSDDLFRIMQQILLRESKIDRDREHLWTISLDNANRVLNIEMVSMGTVNKTLVEPMEVFSVPLQKRSVQLIIVHNHPSGELRPSVDDKEITDRLIQVGKIINVPVLDHLIISEKSYYSFKDSGLMSELEKSLKYVAPYEIKRRYEKEAQEVGEQKGKKDGIREVARKMKKEGYEVEAIMNLTGLSKSVINRLKTE